MARGATFRVGWGKSLLAGFAGPADYPLVVHLHPLGEHLAYGVTAESVRRSLLRLLCYG